MAFQNDSIFWVELEKIVPNPYQPRREFDQSRLEELAESIRMYGVLQPLTVTRREIQRDDGSFHTEYELIAGERRLRSSKLAGISLVPVIIRDGEQNEQEKLELAIIENLQREDLNAVDRALAFKQLSDTFNLTNTQVAKKVGRSREYVSNSVRLLALPEEILQALRTADISEGHARTLLMLNDKPEEQDTVFREILLKKLSVREVERISRGIASEKVRKHNKSYDPELAEMEKQFTETLGTRVQIQKTEFGGKVTIDYFSPEDLQYMLERMRQEAAEQAAGRRPFTPPGEMTDDTSAEEVAAVTDATPLSALIAQLQQAEAGDDRYAEPIPDQSLRNTEPEVSASVSFETESAPGGAAYPEGMKSAPVASDQSQPVAPERPTSVRVVTTNAPVSLVSADGVGAATVEPVVNAPAAAQAVAPEPATQPQTVTEPVATPPTPPRQPRVVAVLRDRTSAMYVATPVEQSVTRDPVAPSESVTEAVAEEVPGHTQTPEPDEADLYSIRNFNV